MVEGREHIRDGALSEAALVAQIKRVYEESERTAGYRKVYHLLRRQSILCSIDRVKKLMNKYGIKSVVRCKYKPQTTSADSASKAFDNLLGQNFNASQKGQIWVSDITYIRVGFKWTYLAMVIDLYNREPVGWAHGLHPNAQLACDALKMAIRKERPPKGLIHHSDRGSQYTSNDYRKLLCEYQIVGSMSRKGNPYDNAVAESFFKALKTEWTNRCHYNTMHEAYISLYRYIEVFYKYQRLHESLGYQTPKSFEKLQEQQILAV